MIKKTSANTGYSLWRVNGYQQGFRSVASFGFGGQESTSKPPQAICKPLAFIKKRKVKNLKLTLIFSFSFLLTVGQVRWNPELKTALLIDTISNLKAQQPEEQLKDIKTWIISKEGRNVKMEGSNIITAGFSLPLKDYEKTGTKYSNRFVDFNFRAELIENEIVFKVTDFSYREKLIYKIGSESVEFERDKFYEKQSKGKKKSRTWFKDEIDEELRKFLEELRQEMK